jgi:hypothetical protein
MGGSGSPAPPQCPRGLLSPPQDAAGRAQGQHRHGPQPPSTDLLGCSRTGKTMSPKAGQNTNKPTASELSRICCAEPKRSAISCSLPLLPLPRGCLHEPHCLSRVPCEAPDGTHLHHQQLRGVGWAKARRCPTPFGFAVRCSGKSTLGSARSAQPTWLSFV